MNFISSDVINTEYYQKFLKVNSGKGNLKIRVFAASEAIPVKGVRIIVSSLIDEHKVIFFDGLSDSSGMVETISLPAPILLQNNLEKPLTVLYKIDAIYLNKEKYEFNVNMYDGICVVQNINITSGDNYVG